MAIFFPHVLKKNRKAIRHSPRRCDFKTEFLAKMKDR